MSWVSPSDPVGGTVITTAYAVSNILDPIRWLRLMTGNADPPGSSYVVVSTSTTGTSWQKVPADALASGVALANLGYTPVNRASDLNLSGPHGWGATGYLDGGANFVGLYSGQHVYLFNSASPGTPVVDIDVVNKTWTWTGAFFAATATLTSTLTAAGATLTAVLNGTSAIFSGNVQAGSVTNLGNETIGGTLGVTGTITGSTTVQGTRLIATVADGATPPLSIAAAQAVVTVPNLVADKVDGAHASATPTASTIPIADGTGKLDAGWLPSSGISGVPSGLIGYFATAAAIAAGWSRYSAADGRMIVCAGTTFSVTWSENTDYGSSWSHTHTDSGHSHGPGSLSVSGTTGDNSSANGVSSGAGNAAAHPHNHSFSASVGGTTNNGTAVISSDAWTIPSRALVAAQKS